MFMFCSLLLLVLWEVLLVGCVDDMVCVVCVWDVVIVTAVIVTVVITDVFLNTNVCVAHFF